jgi:hypothetical protein
MIGLALGGKQDKRNERICLTDIAFVKYGVSNVREGIVTVRTRATSSKIFVF